MFDGVVDMLFWFKTTSLCVCASTLFLLFVPLEDCVGHPSHRLACHLCTGTELVGRVFLVQVIQFTGIVGNRLTSMFDWVLNKYLSNPGLTLYNVTGHDMIFPRIATVMISVMLVMGHHISPNYSKVDQSSNPSLGRVCVTVRWRSWRWEIFRHRCQTQGVSQNPGAQVVFQHFNHDVWQNHTKPGDSM